MRTRLPALRTLPSSTVATPRARPISPSGTSLPLKRNEDARRLYQKTGYRVFSEDPGHWYYIDHTGKQQEVNDPTWVMEKRLVR